MYLILYMHVLLKFSIMWKVFLQTCIEEIQTYTHTKCGVMFFLSFKTNWLLSFFIAKQDPNTGIRTKVPFARFTVNSGKRYRFRVINAASLDCPIMFSVEDHTLTVITTDGNPVEPLTVKSILIYPGKENANMSHKSLMLIIFILPFLF